LVCDTSNALEGWNGTDKDSGDPCSAGTYFYLIKITLENKRAIHLMAQSNYNDEYRN